jgi:hypothetical protein
MDEIHNTIRVRFAIDALNLLLSHQYGENRAKRSILRQAARETWEESGICFRWEERNGRA